MVQAKCFLTAFARRRKFYLRVGVPDWHRGAKRSLRDFTTGALLHCCPPPDGLDEEEDDYLDSDDDLSPSMRNSGPSAPRALDVDEMDEDFDELVTDIKK